jgi:hypothetical protein
MSARKQNKGPTRKCRVSIGKADPAFAAIGRQKQLFKNWHAVSANEPPPKTPDRSAWDKRNEVALIEFCFTEKTGLFDSGESGDEARTLLKTLAKALPTLKAA